MDLLLINSVTPFWGISCKRIREDIVITGSPERCLERLVVEDEKGRLFVLEKIAQSSLKHKTRISQTLQYLYERDIFSIQHYLHSSNGQFVAEAADGCYQMVPFVAGVPLPRPGYVADGWRGVVMADFLMDLRQASSNMPYYREEKPFSIKIYIEEFITILRQYEPTLQEVLLPALSFLNKRFLDVHDHLPRTFCHGDYHPLNIIWGEDHIRAVIDWEFAGYKPEIYDLALLIGCIGIEDPEGLLGGLVLKVIHTLKEKGQIHEMSWAVLLEFVVATRFAWLAEWLRKGDREMIELEVMYMKLLVDHEDLLKKAWLA